MDQLAYLKAEADIEAKRAVRVSIMEKLETIQKQLEVELDHYIKQLKARASFAYKTRRENFLNLMQLKGSKYEQGWFTEVATATKMTENATGRTSWLYDKTIDTVLKARPNRIIFKTEVSNGGPYSYTQQKYYAGILPYKSSLKTFGTRPGFFQKNTRPQKMLARKKTGATTL